LATPELRQKPTFVGPDGVNNTFLGYELGAQSPTGGSLNTSNAQCQNNPNLPNFLGTSAATPHAAGIAALMLQVNGAVTPTQIYTALENSATAIGSVPTTGATPTYNFNAGYGFINADAALSLIPVGPPALTLSANSIALGGSATITWSSVATSGCTASGAWSGALGASGTKQLTPTTLGVQTYTLACTGAADGTLSASTSVSLNVAALPPTPTLALSSAAIALGTSATLTWSDSGATSCSASGSGWSGTQSTSGTATETPTAIGTYTYTLQCTNAAGSSAPTTVTLDVVAKPTITSFTATPTSIAAGGSSTLSWASTNASTCTASGSWSGTQATDGTETETPKADGTYKFTLTCANGAVASAPSTVMLTVTAPTPTATLTASASSIVVGSTATLTWVSTNATSCTASGSWSGTLATSGSQTVAPTATGTDTYSLTCSNGTASSSPSAATITVTSNPSSGGSSSGGSSSGGASSGGASSGGASSGGGGGALDGISLLILGGLAAVARRRLAAGLS